MHESNTEFTGVEASVYIRMIDKDKSNTFSLATIRPNLVTV